MYSKAFNRVIPLIISFEGGYANDPNDNGGETKWGIAAKFNPGVDIKNLTVEQAKDIYFRKYWLPIAGIETLEPPLQLVAFDTSVNSGPGTANRMIVESGGDWETLLSIRLDFLTRHEDWPHYSRGWTRRITHLMRVASSLEDRSSSVKIFSPFNNKQVGEGTLVKSKVYLAELDAKAYRESGGQK
jgi:lysozyme family protein